MSQEGPGEKADLHVAEVAKLLGAMTMTVGALVLSAFALVERIFPLKDLAREGGTSLLALLPSLAALSFLGCARVLGWLVGQSIPGHAEAGPWDRIRSRLTVIEGAYGLFAFVISCLLGLASGIAFELAAIDYSVPWAWPAVLFGLLFAAGGFVQMLLGTSPISQILFALMIFVLVVISTSSAIL